MRVSLIFPPFYLDSLYNLPPLGLLNLATALRYGGHEPTVRDFVLDIRLGELALGPDIYKDCARAILEEEPELAAFSAQCATYPPLVQIARELKKLRPALPILVGGHNASFVDERTLQQVPEIDIVARGEGEATMTELADALRNGLDPEGLTAVDGVTFRAPDGTIIQTPERALIEDLDTLPLPDYGFVPSIGEYARACGMNRNIAILEIGRGCPHACVYCSESAFWRRSVRTFSVDRMVKEMKRLRDDHEADCFVLSYDQFTADKRFVREFCERVIDEGVNRDVSWYCISRLDTVDDALLGLMREAGLESMCYGIDSGSAKTLAFINKCIDPSLLKIRVAETTRHGVTPTLSFIVGFPDETREDIDATLALALDCVLQGDVSPLVQMPTVLSGTALHERYSDDLIREVDTYFALGLEFDGGRRLPMDDALIDEDPALYSSFYNLRCAGVPLAELGAIADEFPLVLNLFPKSFLMLTRAAAGSASTLFREFRAYVANSADAPGGKLNAHACFAHFPAFLQEKAHALGLGDATWRHLETMAQYETLGLAAARPQGAASSTEDSTTAGEGAAGPRLAPGVVVERLEYDIPGIIEDMRQGVWRQTYPQDPVALAFKHQHGQLEVARINDFGVDFLHLCNGTRPVADIAAALRPVHGAETPEEVFMHACVEAVETFRTMRFVEMDSVYNPTT